MVTPALRPYQTDVLARIDAAIAGGARRIILVAPTGSGKTVIAADAIRRAAGRGERVLFIAHRRELIHQAHAKLYDAGIDAGIILAKWPARLGEPVQVAAIQTLWARAFRSSRIEAPAADLVVIDECHRALAHTYQKLMDAYPAAIILGMTATPCRGDGRGLGNAFERIIECPAVAELIGLGHLVGTRVYAPVKPDLEGVKVRMGDYVEGQLETAMDKPKLVGDIVTHWLRLAERRKTVVFATGVAHSVHIRDEFRRAGVVAEHVDGSTPADERAGILKRLSDGTIEVVSNCMVLTEGWDQPDVSCIVLARPTKHMGLYRQMCGRVLRPAPGKADALVIDHSGAIFEHGFVEEPVEWTLDKDSRVAVPTQALRAAGLERKLVVCPECGAVRRQGAPCPACGWRPVVKSRAVVPAEGELDRVARDRSVAAEALSAEHRASFHAQLAWIAEERGYKPGWAAYKYKERFGNWPLARHVEPQLPADTTRSWVRSRQIAWAKAKEAQDSPRRAEPATYNLKVGGERI